MNQLIKRTLFKLKLRKQLDPRHQAWLAHEWRELAYMLLGELSRYGVGEHKESVDKIVAKFHEKKLRLK